MATSSARAPLRQRRGTASPTASRARGSTGSRTPAPKRWSSTPRCSISNFVELSRFGGELSFCAPSDYIKINDDKYVYSRVEAEFSGTMTTYCST